MPKRALCVWMLAGLLLVGCQPTAPAEVPTPRQVILTPPNAHLPTETTALVPMVVPPQSQLIRQAQLLDQAHGWALIEQSLRWTDDAGRHWRTVAVPLAAGQSIAGGFFWDAARGWLLLNGPNDTVKYYAYFTIARTSDGGGHWQLIPLVNYADCYNCLDLSIGIERMYFSSPAQGWVQINRTESANSLHADLFVTADGGASWQPLPTTIPTTGAMSFASGSQGWVTGACCVGPPDELWETYDGGHSWQQFAVKPPHSYQALGPPVPLGTASSLFALALPDAQNTYVDTIEFYSIARDQRNWQRIATLVPAPHSLFYGADMLHLQAVSQDTWFLATSDRLYQTHDAGASWQTVAVAPATAAFVELQFRDALHGLSLVQRCENNGPCIDTLMQTSDAGQRWAALAP